MLISPLSDHRGFTLAEMLIAITVLVLIVITISGIFVLNQDVFRTTNTKAELLQNARTATDTMGREIRQAVELVTTLPANDSNPAEIAHELEFEDGHTDSQVQYIRYYLDGTDLKRQIKVYYFSTNPSVYVHWNDVDPFGGPENTTIDDRLMAEFFSHLDFFGSENITIRMTLEKNRRTIDFQTIINPRNIWAPLRTVKITVDLC